MRVREMLEEAPGSLQRVRTIGVPIIASSGFPNPLLGFNDCVSRLGRPIDVIAALARLRFSVEAALAASTSSDARAMADKELGRIAQGMKADLAVVSEDPR